MSWHATAGLIDRYLTDELGPTDVMSIEAHLPECTRCQEMVTRRFDRRRLTASWLEIERRLTAPVPRDTRETPMTTEQPERDHETRRGAEAAAPAAPPRRRRRPQLLVAAGFLATLLIVLGAALLSNEDDAPVAEPDPTVTTATAVDPTTTSAAPSTTVPIETTTTTLPPPPIEMVWAQVDSQSAFGQTDAVWSVIEGGPGLLAVGSVDGGGGYNDGAVWASVDGESWERVGDPAAFGGIDDPVVGSDRNQVIMSITAGPGGYVAVGFVDRRSGDVDPPIWFSANGTDWRRVIESGADGSAVDFAIVTSNGAGYLALGNQAWSSPDGLTWSRIDGGSFDDLDGCWVPCNFIPPSSVSSTGFTAFAVNAGQVTGQSPFILAEPEVWTSIDGASWTRNSVSDRPAWVSGVTRIEGRLVAAGYDQDGAAVWASDDDGTTWTRVVTIVDSSRDIFPTRPIAVDGVWIIGALDVHGPRTTGNVVSSAVVFASEDQGARWQQVYSQSHSDEGLYLKGVDARPAGVRDLIWFEGRFIAVGSTGNGSAPIWIGTRK